MKNTLLLNTLCLGLIGLGCQNMNHSHGARMEAVEEDEENEQDVALNQVPPAVMKAAQAAVPGLVVTEAEMEVEGKLTTYTLEGTANGTEYKIEVTAEGKLLEVAMYENEDDEQSGDEDDDDDDEEDDD